MQHPNFTFFQASAQGRAGQLGGCLGIEATAQVRDSGDPGKAVPGWVRVPWLRRGGHRLELGWRAWKLLPHSLEHLQEYLGSFNLIFK